MQPSVTYDSKTIRFHWVSAAMILALWVIGQAIDFFPKGTPKATAQSVHITLGALLVILLAARVAWRFQGGVKLPPVDPGMMGKLATGAHHLLYLLMVSVVMVGLAAVWIRGDNIFGLLQIPEFDPGNKVLRHNVVELHGLLANILLGLACFHAMMAIWHHRITQDGVLKRMWPGLTTSPCLPPLSSPPLAGQTNSPKRDC